MKNKGEIILYHPENTLEIEVRLEDETVWLTQAQMVELFQSTKQNISLHINNVYKENELERSSTVKYSLTVQKEGDRSVKRKIEYYNLDVIISVGYRVKSKRGTQFRQWAMKIIRDYLLKGSSFNKRIEHIEERMDTKFSEYDQKFDFFIRTSLPPVEGIFFDGQLFDAYKFAADLIKSARKSIILIDNYVDESVLMLLTKRDVNVAATIYTAQISKQLTMDLQRHNAQYEPIIIKQFKQSHDRSLLIDEKDIYHIGASLKDLGKKWFAFSKLNLNINDIMGKIV
ncbi:virulence RhuM family protein [Parabacteroides faecis]|uniref:virulence RhuM family protein n=1 Tax=Parabacteroides TaxID=375288 RepID=UPI000F00E1F6|nr:MULTISPECIES: RhuM family protein [Parabacteroides]MBC8620313.1 virulence RhuM family protein [Parabacteroides faecis]RHR96657.1 DNA-binding protein [Parabacteroides sp. AF14-59]